MHEHRKTLSIAIGCKRILNKKLRDYSEKLKKSVQCLANQIAVGFFMLSFPLIDEIMFLTSLSRLLLVETVLLDKSCTQKFI